MAKISVIDTDAKLVIRTVDLLELNLGLTLLAKPHHVAVEPDGSFWCVSLIGANNGAELYDGLSSLQSPPGSSNIHSTFDEIATSALNDACGDWVARR